MVGMRGHIQHLIYDAEKKDAIEAKVKTTQSPHFMHRMIFV